MIQPTEAPYEYRYPISRKIGPGEVERFHIMIGSPVSCNLGIKFRFFIDKGQIVESEEFELNIWNPRDLGLHSWYKDGDVLSREVEDLARQIEQYPHDRWASRRLEKMKRMLENYPFIASDEMPY
jgi:hypothetical protein